MLMTFERRPAVRTLRGWAISVLQDAGAIRECEEHGWMQDHADPHAPQARVCNCVPGSAPGCFLGRCPAEVKDVLDATGHTCAEYPSGAAR
jgi:hypothetical protein